MKDYYLLQYMMTNRKIKETGKNPLIGCKFVNKEVGERVGEKVGERVGEKEKMSGKTFKVIIEIIKQNNELTIPEMAAKIGATQRSAERNFEKLKQKRVGSALFLPKADTGRQELLNNPL